MGAAGDDAAWRALLEELTRAVPRGIVPGLARVRAALAAIGEPAGAFDVVHVAGTNGKGSTCAMIAHGVTDRRVGLYTSPHLHSLTERFRVDGAPLARERVREAWEAIRAPLAALDLTFFEAVTVLAFELFRREGVALAVLETGLGGRLDATNVIARPLVTALTRIALDHQAWLGDDLASIAFEKAGILRAGVPCVVGLQAPAADAVITRVAQELGAPLVRARCEGPAEALVVCAGARSSPPLALGLAGAHQRENAAVAVGVLGVLSERGVGVDLARALEASWPGRLERLAGSPPVLVDGAHNPDGVAALGAHLDAAEPARPRVLVFGAMRDKEWPAMLGALRESTEHVVLTRAALARSEDPAQMAAPGDHVAPTVPEAVALARALAGPEGLVVVAGSLFVVAEARAAVLGIEGDPPVAL
ncbi:MAG: bifunctional folylpolyglutamate synthase/dihydrofolate synthase [Sandaracinaceae bacterium]|nr:bifunctional folylpolyglutamate synthase/dihydrofolate synthase [Sandaracinaceae bacterium]